MKKIIILLIVIFLGCQNMRSQNTYGVCDEITLGGCFGVFGCGQSFFYRTSVLDSWQTLTPVIYVPTLFGPLIKFTPRNLNNIGTNYTGNLFVLSETYDNLTGNTFSSILTYTIIPCSPDLMNTSSPNYTICSNTNGEVTFTFNRPLDSANGEKFLFNYNIVGGPVFSVPSNDPNVEMISPFIYRLKNIPPGTYEFKYQTQFNNNTPSSAVGPTNFTITQTLPLFFTVTPINPPCSGDNAGITITASGGTLPYYYILGNSGVEVEFATPYNLYGLDPSKSYDIKVIDKNKCIENTQ